MSGKIKLNAASGGGSFSLQAPSSSANNRVLTLPDSADGTIAKTSDISFTSYAVIADQKSAGTNGGTFTSGDWRTRDLNTELSDADGIVSISSNQFTLQAGTYFIEASAPAYKIDRHIIKLRQTSGTAADIAFGTAEYCKDSYQGYNKSFLYTRVTISVATTYEIQHKSEETFATYGFGIGANFSTEIYTIVKIFKES